MSFWACPDGKLDLARPSPTVKLAEERGERSRRGKRKKEEERERDRNIFIFPLLQVLEREREEMRNGISEIERDIYRERTGGST